MRRRFLPIGLAAAAAVFLWTSPAAAAEPVERDSIAFGIFADSQYAEKAPAMGRFYRDSDEKLARFVEHMNELKPAFVIGLGDFTDSGPSREIELGYLRRIDGIYRGFKGDRHYVIGNHDLDSVTKKEFLSVTRMRSPHYSFDRGPFHFVVLDANYGKNYVPAAAGNTHWTESHVPPAEQKWLVSDLARVSKPIIVFIHQRLDDDKLPHTVKNAPGVRQILERSGRVIAVFQGHDHKGGYNRVNGIHYVTLRGMVEGSGLENNAYALVTASANGHVYVRGFGNQKTMKLRPAPATHSPPKTKPRQTRRGTP